MTHGSQLSIRIAQPHERSKAISLLYPERSPPEIKQYVSELTAADSSGEFSLSHLHVAVSDEQIVGTGLLSFAPGRVALIWPAEAVGENRDQVKSLLMDAMLRCVDRSDAAFGQTLLPVHRNHASALSAAGMTRITSLSFLSVSLVDATVSVQQNSRLSADAEAKLRFSNYDSVGDEVRATRLLAQTHIDSADCPEVSKLLQASDLLDGHLATGQFRSDLSFVARQSSQDAADEQDVGIAILSEHSDLSSIEIVYIGIVPSARRRGLGRIVMEEAIRRAKTTPAITMFLAVDQRNIAARLLYERLGFSSTDEQEVWLYVPCRS